MGFGPPVGGNGGIPPATVVVAASNSKHKDKADYVCDGIDDQVEIQTALNSLPSTGGSVYLMEGRYNINGGISIPYDNVCLFGDGIGTWLRLVDDKNIDFTMIMIDTKHHVTISKLRVDGNQDNNSSGYMYGIRIKGASSYCVVDSCYIHDWREHAITGEAGGSGDPNNCIISNNILYDICGSGGTSWETILLKAAKKFLITGNIFYKAARSHIYMTYKSGPYPCEDIIIHNNYFDYIMGVNYSCLIIRHVKNVVISGNIFNNCQRILGPWSNSFTDSVTYENLLFENNICLNSREIYVWNDQTVFNRRFIMKGNIIGEMDLIGVRLGKAKECVISDNVFYNVGKGTNNTHEVIYFDSVEESIISDNVCKSDADNKPKYGISLENSKYNTISNNKISDTATTSIIADSNSGFTIIEGNHLQYCAGTHIEVSGGSSVVSGNLIYNGDGRGIYVNGASDSVISGNMVRFVGTGGIILSEAARCIISNNRLYDCGISADNTYDAITLSTSSYNSISSNVIYDFATNKIKYGVNEDSGDENEVIGNVIKSYQTAAINLTGVNSEQAHNIT